MPLKSFITSSACVLSLLISTSLTTSTSASSQTQAGDAPRFRLGIIGLVHSHAWGHLRNIAKMPGVELVGIAEPNQGLRDEAAKAAPGVPLYEDYRKLLDEKKPEGVWAFVENDRHLEIAKICAPRGIHLIFEKPMAGTFEQAKEMLSLATKHKIKLMTNYQMAWWPENYSAYDFARSGEIGKVWRVRSIIGHGGPAPNDPNDARGQAFWKWLNDEKRGGGALVDFVGYGAVWCRWYLGMPKSVYAITTHTRPDVYHTNTNATVILQYADNGVGIIEGSWDLPRSFQDVEVFGNKGSVYMARNKIEAQAGRERKEVAIAPLAEDRRDPVAYFIQRIRSNQPLDGMVSPEFNLDAMAIVEAARRSAETGKPVSLPLP
ncbi:MAG TPA: Gfo/Idh/MocA family oxidoreductase [Blastocatellia bacterium]|nr:Gfo/Idh/MocA family oxidoreductase [Blastocatellia bacterium]